MESASVLLAPVIALVIWTALIWVWMYATRIPAITRMKMVMDANAPRGEQMAQLPPRVRWKADNYNHLLEQPQLFYAVAISLVLLGDASELSQGLAWAFVGSRVVHSLVQTLFNHILTRFAVFFVSSLILFALTGRAAMLVF